MRALTVSLTPKQADRLRDAVDGGGYASNSEIVREALRLWEQREELRALELERFKRAYDAGMASGDGPPRGAVQDLQDIRNHIADHNEPAADKLIARIFDRLELACEHPRARCDQN